MAAGIARVGDGQVHTAVFKMDNQQGPAVQAMEFCSILGGSLDGRGVWGECIHVYEWLSSFSVHQKLSQHCLLTGYTPIQNKNFKKMNKNKSSARYIKTKTIS